MLKQLVGLAIMSGLLSYAPAALAQEDWTEVVVNGVGDRFLIDRNSLETRGNSIWYWQYREFQQPNNAFLEVKVEGPVYGVLMYQSVDCTAGVERLRQLIVHGKERKVLREFNYGETGSLAQPMPGSSANTVLRYVCEGQRSALNPYQEGAGMIDNFLGYLSDVS